MKKTLMYITAVLFISFNIVSCKPADYWYGEYLENGEIYYPGRIDSLTIIPGNQRAQLRFRITTDPKITNLKIYLRNSLSANQEHYEFDVQAGDHGQLASIQLDDLSEATYTATVFSFTAEGDSSRAVTAAQFIYGISYINTLTNRPFLRIDTTDPTTPFFVFSREPNLPREGVFYPMQFTEIEYTSQTGETKVIRATPYEEFIDIADVAIPSTIRYRTAYKPIVTSLDTFYTGYSEVAYE